MATRSSGELEPLARANALPRTSGLALGRIEVASRATQLPRRLPLEMSDACMEPEKELVIRRSASAADVRAGRDLCDDAPIISATSPIRSHTKSSSIAQRNRSASVAPRN